MTLRDDWRRVTRKAWSMRLMALAGILSAMEVLLPMFVDAMPRGLFAIATLIVIPGAMVARLVAQRNMK